MLPAAATFEAVTGSDFERAVPRVTVIDETGLVIRARPGNPGEEHAGNAPITNPRGDEMQLAVQWGGTPCDEQALLTLSRTSKGFRLLVVRDTGPPEVCPRLTGAGRRVVLELREAVRAGTVSFDIHQFPGQFGTPPWGPVAAIDTRAGPAGRTRLQGTLSISDTCVTVGGVSGQPTEVTPVFPAPDTGWQAAEESVWYRDELWPLPVEIKDGDQVEFLGVTQLPAASSWVSRPDESCSDNIFVIGVIRQLNDVVRDE
jgi:hypothetical protein